MIFARAVVAACAHTAVHAFTCRLNLLCGDEIPNVLKKHPKISNPWPNVDGVSGAALHTAGIVDTEFYTVLFGIARCLGISAGVVWSRMLQLPIERPSSLTISSMERKISTTNT